MKRVSGEDVAGDVESLPVWERGLKLNYDPDFRGKTPVAPRVGAWIETR